MMKASEVTQPAVAVVAVAMPKGGVGKTETTLHVGRHLAARGLNVLMIDMDPQAGLTQRTGAQAGAGQHVGMAFGYGGTAIPLASLVVDTAYERLRIVTASHDLANVNDWLASKRYGRLDALHRLVVQLGDVADVVLLDCPAGTTWLTLNALYAATGVVVPLRPEVNDILSVPDLWKTMIELYNEGAAAELLGYVATFVEPHTYRHREGLAVLSKRSDREGMQTQSYMRSDIPLAPLLATVLKANGSDADVRRFNAVTGVADAILRLAKKDDGGNDVQTDDAEQASFAF